MSMLIRDITFSTMNTLMKSSSLRSAFKLCRQNLGISTVADRVNSMQIVNRSTTVSPCSNFNETANSITQNLIKSYGIKNENILQKVVDLPILSNSDPSEWRKVMEIFTFRGSSAIVSVQTIVKYPALLKLSSSRINRAWDDWVDCFQETEIVREMIEKQPIFLSISSTADIRSRYEQLKHIVLSKKAVAQILITCPQIMFQSLTELHNVSDYLSEVMIVRNAAEYSKSTVLGCSLQEVMVRHEFLDKCGKYKPPNLKISESIPTGNATLSEIYDTTEEEFACKVAGVTLEEFVVFQSMFAKEWESRKTNSDETDSDDE
ncbi:Transcription termination factor 4, mitochondrial [Frankliniella fusca]|uniref:Transcription termination factor 4, mitochondrial n=1 Tax=Frankliniella fusca TaxID=407009 RepID=A0AAE1H4T3_9NEOP|nr:Transcription termination factor 4, mitochondrial [Frankliniella fusca]